MQEECFRGRHLQYVVALGLPLFIVWVVGLPTFATLYLGIQHRTLARLRAKSSATVDLRLDQKARSISERMAFRYGILFKGYKKNFWWWEAVLAFRKAIIAMLGVLGGILSKGHQSLLACYLVFFCMMLHLAANPFMTHVGHGKDAVKVNLHAMEFWSLATAFTTFWSGSIFESDNLPDGSREVLTVFVVLINIVTFTWLVVGFFKEFRTELKLKKKAGIRILPRASIAWGK